MRNPIHQEAKPFSLKHAIIGAVAAMAIVVSSSPVRAGLVNQWTGDGYTSGNWVDGVGNVAATASGSPLAVANAFGSHAGVTMNGGYFIIPSGVGPAGLSNFTVVVVFMPTNYGSFSGNYYNCIPLAAFDIGGSGQTDWGLSYGGTLGCRLVTGAGVQTAAGAANGDILQTTPNLALFVTHAVAYRVQNSPSGTNLTTWADGVMVASNSTVNIMPRSTVNTVFVGGGTFVTPRFPGQIAAIQFYNDSTNDCALRTASLTNTYAAPPPITLPWNVGGDPGQTAPVTIGIPLSLTPTTVTFTSANPSVFATTNVTIPAGTTTTIIGLRILSIGTASVTASSPGLGSAYLTVAGLDESGFCNQWLSDTYVNNSATWVDSISGVTAVGTGSEVSVPGAFGARAGVARSATGSTTGNNGFNIPAGTPPGGFSNYTVAVAFKPTATGGTGGAYYNGQIIMGYDIGGAGQADWGMSWGGNTSGATGQEVLGGIGRSGGDSAITGAAGAPLALNTTHAAVMQVNAAARTQTLYVDGMQVGQNTGLTNIAPDITHIIPLITTLNANIGSAFPGYVAEVRVYTNANVNGAALTGMLLSKYTGLPLLALSSTQPFADVGSNITVTVTIPASASFAGSFNVTITSDSPGVASPATPVTFAKGVTTQTISFRALSVGIATLTASGSGVTSATLQVGGLAPRALVEALRASSLPTQFPGLSNGDSIDNWYGDTNVTTLFAFTGVGNAPTFDASATPNGMPAASFNLGPMLLDTNSGSISPVTGFTNFSIAMVFKAGAAGVGAAGGQWYSGIGVLDGDEGGAHYDWGTALDASGNFIFGVGNTDLSISQANYDLVSPLFHAIVMAWDGLNQQMRLFIDDKPGTTITGSAVPTGPRENINIMLGGTSAPPAARTNANQLYIVGEFAEVQFYSGALTGLEATNLITSLQTTYGLLWPDRALVNITASPTLEDIGSNITCTVTIPAGVNASRAVTVAVTSSNPGVVALAGGGTTNLTFAAGAANVRSFNAVTVGAGSSTLTASSAGLVASSATITVQPVPTLIDAFRASSLTNQVPGIVDGQAVATWLSDSNAVAANQTANAPVFVAASTPSGTPSVAFNATNSTSLLLLGTGSPVGGLTNFSVVVVFKATAAESSTSANWYSMAGILDAEEANTTCDWGLAMDSGGNLNFGVGAPDYTLLNPNYDLVNANVVHIAVVAFDELHQRMQITVDDKPTTTTPAGTTLSTYPRDPSWAKDSGGDIYFGQGATDGIFWNGELLEADFYNGAIKNPAQVIAALKAAYNVPFQDQVTISLTPLLSVTTVRSTVALTLTIPTNANASQAVTVSITNSSPSTVGLAGAVGGVLSVTFPTGTTNAQTVTGQAAAIGTATLTYGAPSLLSGSPVTIKVIDSAPNTLVGEWAFNDAAHPFVDSSGFRPAGTHDGVPWGTVTLTNDLPPGLTGYSLNLMGVGAVQILNTRLTEAGYRDTFDDLLSFGMTISVWVKLNASWDGSAWVPFASKRGEDNLGYQLRRYNFGPFAAFTIRGTPGVDDTQGLTAYEDGNWHHIAGVWDGRNGIRSLYVDGFLDANASLTGDFGPPAFAPTNNLVIGARDRSNDGSGTAIEAFFLGLLKDVRIYNYPLTQAQVRTAMAGQTVGGTVTLQIQHSNEDVVMTWTQGKLLQAASVTGPWTTNATATSPYAVPATNAQSFFRVQVSP